MMRVVSHHVGAFAQLSGLEITSYKTPGASCTLFVFSAIHLLILVGRDWMLARFQCVTHRRCLLGIKP